MSVSACSRSWPVGAGLAGPDLPSAVTGGLHRQSNGHPEAPGPVGTEGSQLLRYRRVLLQDYVAERASSGFVRGCAPGIWFGRALLFGAGFPTVKYLRIFSRRFAPSPRIASKSSTLLNAPYDFRICRIFSAVAGPIPGTCCSSSEVAVLRSTGLAGGFFFPASADAEKIKPRKRKMERSRIGNRRAIAAI